MPCIECIWGKDNRFLVNPDGQVWPCCYLGNIGYSEKINGRFKDKDLLKADVDDIVHPLIQDYFENLTTFYTLFVDNCRNLNYN